MSETIKYIPHFNRRGTAIKRKEDVYSYVSLPVAKPTAQFWQMVSAKHGFRSRSAMIRHAVQDYIITVLKEDIPEGITDDPDDPPLTEDED